ncbi:MAG: hypothetical protein SPI18_05290 [Prevotella sp.]|nr:hypothetical protein [Prevotella sp.]
MNRIKENAILSMGIRYYFDETEDDISCCAFVGDYLTNARTNVYSARKSCR